MTTFGERLSWIFRVVFLARSMDLRSGTTTKTDNVISSTASVETENEFADTKIAVETENGDYSECVSTETSVDTDNEKHSEFDPEHSIEMDNENSQFVDSDNSVVTENGVQNEITLSSLAGMLSRLGDIMCENKHELHTSMTRLEEKIDRNQNDIYQFNNSMKIMEDKLNNSTADIARLEKNVIDQFHTVENEIGHVKNNFKNIVPQLKTDLRKDLKVELTGILKQEISFIKDTLQQEITVIVQGKNDSLRAELLDIHNSLRTELAEANESLCDEFTGINDSLRANLANNVDSNRDESLNATNDVTDESNHTNGKNSVETDSVHKNGKKSVVAAEMSAAHQEQEFTPERNGQETSPSHSAQDSGDSDSDTVRERAPERDMSFSFQVAPPDWFTDKMDRMYQNLNETSQRIYQNLNETIQRNEQSADFRYTSLKKQLESVQQQVSDNANALSRILQNRCDPKMSAPSTVGSDNTDVKRRSQSNRPVATTTTFSQQSSVCSTVKNAPPVYQTIPHLSTPSPACYPYQNAPNLARKTNLGDQSQSVLQVTCMPVPPPSHIPIAHSTSQGMSQAGGYQNQGSVNLSSGSQPSGNQGSGNQGSANQNSINQSSVNADCKPQTLKKPENVAPKFPVYNLGECFHNFITIYESILQRYGMMDEAALRLPECLSLPALSLYFSLPEGVRSNYKQTVAALRGFWPALPGVSNFDDLNENYGLPILKQGHDSIEIFAPKVCSVASEIANGDTQRFNRLAKYLLWKGLSVDVTIWMDKCYDDSITFADFYILCRRLLNDPPPRRSPSTGSSQYSYRKGSESPNWRERSSPLTQYSGSMSPNWREKNHSSFKPEQGSMTSAIQNGSSRRSSSISPSRNKTYSQCYGCREYGHHRYECPRRNISPSRRWSGRNSSNSPPRARYPRPGERY